MHRGVVELWTAADWNKHLTATVFGGPGEPVTYLEAHPTGLVEALGWVPSDERQQLAVDLLVDAHRPLVAGAGGSAVSACLQACRARAWSETDTRPPPFFSLLWITCLVAWGHPNDAKGNFASRWQELFEVANGGVQPAKGQEDVSTARGLVRRSLNQVEIRDLWLLIASWLTSSPDHREFVIPEPPAGHERHVGTSYALSQPDLRDRRWLARAVTELDVAGYDPPPGPVLRGLLVHARDSPVSDEFAGQLARLVEAHRSGGLLYQDPIWTAIRRECMEPVTTAGGVVPLSSLTAVLEEYIDSVEGHVVWNGVDEPPPAPEGTSWRHDPRTDEHTLSGSLWSLLENPWNHIRTGMGRLVREGLVCFARDAWGRLTVVTGAEVVNAEISLVRQDLVVPLRDWAGGSTATIPVSGWVMIRGAELRSVVEELLPSALRGVRQLVRTSAPPTARWVGGVRVGRGAFYRHSRLLPAVSAPEAVAVIDETTRTLLREDERRWVFEPSTPPIGLHVRVIWPNEDGWPDTVLRARFEDVAVQRPQEFSSPDHELEGPEQPTICDGEVGLLTRKGPVIRLGDAVPTARRAGMVVGSIDAPPSEAVLTHYGRPEKLLVSVLHTPTPEVTGRASDASARRRWRNDVSGTGSGQNIALHDGRVLDAEHPALVTLRRAVVESSLPIVDVDEPDAGVLMDQLQRAYADPHFHRTGDELLAYTSIDLGRRRVGRKDYFDAITQLTTAREQMTVSKLFSLLRANVEAGRIELARHRARPASELVGVTPRMRWALVAPLPSPSRGLFEGALVGLVESSTACQIAEKLDAFADVRWLAATTLPRESSPADRLVAPVLKVLTDNPKHADAVAQRHLGGRLGAPGVLPGVPDTPAVSTSADARRPGGFEVADSYPFDGEPRHVKGRTESDGVVVERLVATARNDVYVVVADERVVYTSSDRDWAAARASELAGVPLFGRCRHGILRSRSSLFPRLPIPVGRTLLTHGIGLASSTFDAEGRLASVTYPFGRGVSALDRLPQSWTEPEECSCMTL